MSSSPLAHKKERIYAFDYLRGYFIAVIIIDHVWKFPSLWTAFTGEARLWVTAAEGFVMISGFLIGYIRGLKGMKLPFSEIATTLLKRALMLYVWMVIVSLAYTAIDWYLTAVPNIPSLPAAVGDWGEAVRLVVTMEHPNLWIHFLSLYTIFLALSVPVVWLLRNNKSWLVGALTVAIYFIGIMLDIEWMKWQLLFFVMTLLGFYFESLRSWWGNIGSSRRRQLQAAVYVTTALTLALSVVCVFHPSTLPSALVDSLNKLFKIELFSIPRVLLAVTWFGALAFLFHQFTPLIRRWTFGILEFLGTHSLSAYIIHGFVICAVNFSVAALGIKLNFVLNTLIGIATVLVVYGLLRIPIVAKLIPR